MHLRDLRESDIEELISIAESTGLSFWSHEGFQSHFSDKSAYSRGLVSETGRLVGFIVARFVPEESGRPEAELLNIGVWPDFQGKGGGGDLINDFIDHCVRMKVSRVWLEVRDSNTRAQAVYLRFGFKTVGKRPKLYTSPVEDALLMCRELDHTA